jgi:hypothetical protein
MIIKNLVLAGGGIKGLSYIGAFKYLYDNKLLDNLQSISATSIGTFFGTLLILKFTPLEMRNICIDLDFTEFMNIEFSSFISVFGFDDKKKFRDIIKIILSKKIDPNITLLEFYEKTNIEFNIITSNLTKIRVENFNYKTYPTTKLVDAMATSMNLPFVFSPEINNDKDYLIDGGLFNNYPIDYYNNELKNTLGFNFVYSYYNIGCCNDIQDYIGLLINSFIFYSDNEKQDKYKANTVYLPLCDEKYLKLNVDKEDKINMINIGYNSTKMYFRKKQLYEEQRSENIEEQHDENITICSEIINEIITKVENYIEVVDLLSSK